MTPQRHDPDVEVPAEQVASGAPASIIVPAYNEENRIGPLLPVLCDVSRDLGYLVIVACNGCTDRTVSMARATRGIVVMDIERASKPHALNEAELLAGDVFPRLYVDADVRTDVTSLRLLVEALGGDKPLAVRPSAGYIMKGAPLLARAYYTSRTTVPSFRRWLDTHVEGHHIYGTNAAGRTKFDVFPEAGQIMEDAFFDRMFDASEKVAVLEAHVEVPLPDSTRALLRGMTRVEQGNWELTSWLRENRPDRLYVDQVGPAPRRSLAELLRYYSHGGSTFESWDPRVVAVGLGAMAARIAAKLNARRHVVTGRQADWR